MLIFHGIFFQKKINMNSCISCDENEDISYLCPDCHSLISDKDFDLIPGIDNNVEISNPNFFYPNYIFELPHPVLNKPWTIVNPFHLYDTNKKTVILPLRTKEATRITRGDVICHFRFSSLRRILQKISKYIFKN
jgi:hypothetical protein